MQAAGKVELSFAGGPQKDVCVNSKLEKNAGRSLINVAEALCEGALRKLVADGRFDTLRHYPS